MNTSNKETQSVNDTFTIPTKVYVSDYELEALHLLDVLTHLANKGNLPEIVPLTIGDHRYVVLYNNAIITANVIGEYTLRTATESGIHLTAKGLTIEDLLKVTRLNTENVGTRQELKDIIKADNDRREPTPFDTEIEETLRQRLKTANRGKFQQFYTHVPKYQADYLPFIRVLDSYRQYEKGSLRPSHFPTFYLT